MHMSFNIVQLNDEIPKLGLKLRQAIMHILLSNNKWNLFVAVTTSYSGECVNFTFHEALEEEAINMISALPFFLEVSLNSKFIWTWFTYDGRD